MHRIPLQHLALINSCHSFSRQFPSYAFTGVLSKVLTHRNFYFMLVKWKYLTLVPIQGTRFFHREVQVL